MSWWSFTFVGGVRWTSPPFQLGICWRRQLSSWQKQRRLVQMERRRDVIDLCDSPSPRKERSSPGRGGSPERDNRREKGERWHKRQRLSAPRVAHGRTVVELSDDDDEEDDNKLASRLQEAERSQLRANLDEDLRLAKRLQQEECSGLPPSCSGAFGSMPGLGPVGLGPPSAALGVHGGRWDWLGSLARRPGQGHPFDAAPGHIFAPPRRPAAGQFGHLELLDRDFDEADYEMLLRLDDRRDLQKQAKRKEHSKVLDQLPTRRQSRVEAESESTCAICLETIRAQQLVLPLPCKHEYHKPCILKWLKSCDAPSCPTCKAPVLVAPTPAAPAAPVAASTADGADEQWWHT